MNKRDTSPKDFYKLFVIIYSSVVILGMLFIILNIDFKKESYLLIVVIVAFLIGFGVPIIIALLRKPVHCPKCNTIMPKFRKVTNWNHLINGGWTCKKCGCEMDRSGKEITKK